MGSVLVLLGFGSVAHAVPVTLAFTVGNFPPTFSGIEAPVDPVSGLIVYEAAAVGAPIQSLTSISLVIDGHTYAVGELSFISNPATISTSDLIGGTVDGVGGVSSFTTDDFSIQYDRCDRPGVGANFVYATSGGFGSWRSTNFDSFSLTGPGMVACGEPVTTTVPEPNTFSLLMFGLLVGMPLVRLKHA
jgi:hypothetical protein